MSEPSLPNTLSAEQVRKVAALARLSLTDAQVDEYRVHLGAVLGYVDRLRELDVAGVEPLANPVEETNRLREDVPGPAMPREVMLALAQVTHPPFRQKLAQPYLVP